MQYICTELNEIYGRKACINVHVVTIVISVLENTYLKKRGLKNESGAL